MIGGNHLSGMRRRLPRLSQNVHPQRQHAAQPDGVVDVSLGAALSDAPGTSAATRDIEYLGDILLDLREFVAAAART